MPILISSPLLEDEELRTRDESTGVFNEFGKGFGAGIDQLQGLIGGGGRALIGSLIGSDDMFYNGMAYYNEQMQEAAENQAEIGRIEDIVSDDYGLASLETLGNLALYTSYVVGNFLPSLAGGVGSGAVAGTAGKFLASKGINKKAKDIADKQVADIASREIQKKKARDYARSASAKAGTKGAAFGAVAFAASAGAGESFTRIWEEAGEERVGVALGTGVLSGALDALTPMRVLKKMLPEGSMTKARDFIGDKIISDRRRISRALKAGVETGGIEGTTEMLQEIVQSYAVELVKAESDPTLEGEFLDRMFDEDKRSMYANAFVAGLVGGKGIGLVQGGLSSAPKRPKSQQETVVPEPEPEDMPETSSGEPTDEEKLATGRRRKQLQAVGIPTEDREQVATPEEAIDKARRVQGIPTGQAQGEMDVGDSSDPELIDRRRQDIRDKVREQLDGMPAARQEARRILQREFREVDGTIVSMPKKQSEPVVETEFGGNLPQDITPPIDKMVGKDVEYQGVKGILQKKDKGYVVVSDQGDIFIESGEFQSPEELGISLTDGSVEFERDVQINPDNKKFKLRGKTYTLVRIVRDAEGNPLSLSVRDEKGKKKTIRTKEVVERIDNQLTPTPDINTIMVEIDELPSSVQKEIAVSADPENIPDQVTGQQALEVAQALPQAESLVEQVQNAIDRTFGFKKDSAQFDSKSKYTGSVRRGGVYSLSEAIKEVNAGMSESRTPIDESKVRKLLEGEEKILQDGSKIQSIGQSGKADVADEIANAMVDLYEAGLPKSILNNISAVYLHNNSNTNFAESNGVYSRKDKYITLHENALLDVVRDKNDDTDRASRLRFTLAHEIGHAFDTSTNHTLNAPEWSIELRGAGEDSITLELGDLMGELARNYQQETELGKELSYPFGYSYDWLTSAQLDDAGKALGTIQKEAFAQAFAVFHANGELLQEQAPLTYSYLDKLLRTTERSDASNDQTKDDEPQPREVQREVRTSTESRSVEVQDDSGAGGAGGSSPVAEQASESMGRQTEPQDGDDTGRPIQLANEESDLLEQETGKAERRDDSAEDDILSSPPAAKQDGRDELKSTPFLDDVEGTSAWEAAKAKGLDMSKEARLKRAREMGFDTDYVYYHGTPKADDFDAFKYEYTGKGVDQFGAGFYLTGYSEQANAFTGGRFEGAVIPVHTRGNLLKVDGEKINNLSDILTLDIAQTKNILEQAEPLKRSVDDERMNPLGDRYESFWSDGPQSWMLDQLAEDQAGRDPYELADFFDGDMESYLTALNDVTGYDGIEIDYGYLKEGMKNQIHWKPSNIRSVNAAFDPDMADSPNLLFSPPRETTEAMEDLNRAIREEEGKLKGIKNKIKKSFRRNLTAKGWLPQTVFDEKIIRDGELGAVELDIRQMLGVVDKAIKSNYEEVTDDQLRFLNDALGEKFVEIESLDIDSDIKEGLIQMRTYLDGLSKRYAVMLAEDAQRLQEAGDPDALAKAELINIISSNLGRYLNRSYRAFDDPNWYKKVSDEVLNNARRYLTDQGSTNPERTINEILKNNTAYDSMEAFISESKLGAKDLSILKKRNNEIAPEILALLGEYTDPRINFVKSATKMSRLLFNHDFLNKVKDAGEGVFLFTKDTAPTDAYVPFAAEGSKTMEPLNGYYAEPEVVQAFKDALENEQLPDWYRQWVRFNGMVKYGKTVIAPTTMARNFMSAAFFTIANGHFNIGKIDKSLEVAGTYFTANKGSQLDYLKKIKKLGVIYDTPYAGEMIDLLKDTNFGTDLNLKDGFKGKLGSAFDFATKLYQFGDDFWKIVGFENEVNILMNAKGISREDAEPLAAQRIRDTYPTYSLVGRKVKALRRFPLLGTFVSFPAEIIRTQFNMLRYMIQDAKDPDMVATVPRRALGFGMISGGAYALQEALLNSHDVSEDEEEAIRLLSPQWSRNSNIAITGRDENGNLRYMDLTHLDPYAYFKKPITAILRDQPVDDAVVQAAQELLTPFFGYDISTATILQVWQNEKASGGKVYNETDTPENIAVDIGAHLFKGMGPSVAQNVNRTLKALDNEISPSGRRYNIEDESAAWVGFRFSTFDPKASLYFKTYEFNEGKRNATSLLTKTFRDPNEVSDSELRNAFDRASSARKQTFKDMQRIVEAARKSGLSDTKLMTVLRSNGVTIKDARALISGKPSRWTMSDSTLKNSIKKSDLLFDESTGAEFERRWEIIKELLEAEN